jgi:hypothetical protein
VPFLKKVTLSLIGVDRSRDIDAGVNSNNVGVGLTWNLSKGS